MRSYEIQLVNREKELRGVFKETERAAEIAGLIGREKLQLLLLAEETISMLRSITGEINACFWIVWEGKDFQIHLNARQKLGNEQRGQLIRSSTSQTNDAAKTFLGKLRDAFEQAMSIQRDISNYYSASGVSRSADPSDEIIQKEKWDEYERSILLSVADNVCISIRGGFVEMVISKKFA